MFNSFSCYNEAKAKFVQMSERLVKRFICRSPSHRRCRGILWERSETDVHTASFTNLKSSERWQYFKPWRTSQSVTVKLWLSPQPAVDEEPSVVDAEMRRTGHQGEDVSESQGFCVSHTLCCCWSSDRVPSLQWTRSRVLLMLRWGEQVIREKMFHTHSAAALTESPACGGRGAECCWCWDEENRSSERWCFTHTLLLLKLWQSPQPAVDEEPSVVDAEMRRTGHQGEDVSHTLCCCWSSDRVPSLRWTRSRVLLMLRWGEQVIREKMFHTHSAAAEALTESPACGGRGAECCWCWDEENRSSGRRCFTHTLLLLKLWQCVTLQLQQVGVRLCEQSLRNLASAMSHKCVPRLNRRA